MISHKLMQCRMTLYDSWNIVILVVLLIYIVPGTSCYSCEQGSSIPMCKCEGNTSNCESTVEFEKQIELNCCINTSEPISWYKEIISNQSLIGYNETTKKDYSPNVTRIDQNYIDSEIFYFSDGGQKLLIRLAQLSHTGTYICSVDGKETFKQVLNVEGSSSIKPSLEHISDSNNCPSEVKGDTNEPVTLCCNFTSDSRAQSISTEWYTMNGSILLQPDPNYSIESHCNEKKGETRVSTFVDTSLTLMPPLTYGSYGANVTIVTYNKQEHITKQCIVSLVKKEKDDGPFHGKLIIAIASVVGLAVLGFVIFVVWIGWLYSRYNISIKLLCLYYFQPLKDDADSKMYDAFIAYSEADKDKTFVLNTLLPFFKTNHFSVCIRDINFLPGGVRFHDSTAAVEASQRTILIVSSEFIKSSQCYYEFEVALQNMIDNGKRHKIIPILFESVSKIHLKECKQLERLLIIGKKLPWVESKHDVFLKSLLELMPSKRARSDDGTNQRFYNPVVKLDSEIA